MDWRLNGIVIQDNMEMHGGGMVLPYNGLGRYRSWPLSDLTDDISRSLTQEAEDKWFGYYNDNRFALAVIPDNEYVSRYMTACWNNNIQTRILFVETDRNKPTWHSEVPKGSLLGYDYATSQEFFSALYDDLYGDDTHSSLKRMKLLLNENGLFDNPEDLLTYIGIRNLLIQDGYDLEMHGDFCVFKISLLDSKWVSKE